jgi:hypothetical protein
MLSIPSPPWALVENQAGGSRASSPDEKATQLGRGFRIQTQHLFSRTEFIVTQRRWCQLLPELCPSWVMTSRVFNLPKIFILGQLLRFTDPARHSSLTLVILATQEAEIRRIVVQSQAWETSLPDPILKKPITKEGWRSDSDGRAPA